MQFLRHDTEGRAQGGGHDLGDQDEPALKHARHREGDEKPITECILTLSYI